MRFPHAPFVTARNVAQVRFYPGIDAQAEHRPDVCRSHRPSKTMHLPSISSRPPARAHSLQQPVPLFTVPTSSWRCTNSNRTSNATSNDFPMQPNSLQLTNQVPPRLTRTKCPLSHASPTPKKRSRSLSCQTLDGQTFALCHPLTIGMHRYLRRNICDSRTSPVLQMVGNF